MFGMSFFEWFRFFRISSFLHGEKALPLLAVQECGTVLWLSVGLWGLWWVDCEVWQSAASGACGASLTDCPAPACFVDGGLLGARSAHGITGSFLRSCWFEAESRAWRSRAGACTGAV